MLPPCDIVEAELVSSTSVLLTNLQFVCMIVRAPLKDSMSRAFVPPGHMPNHTLKLFGDISIVTDLTKTTWIIKCNDLST